ncbi:MAG: hypothetical protein QM758_13660 [Armatimonas sp.]
MSVARDHNEWLSLVPTSGPFLSLETLLRVFPQGLPARDSETARLLRLAWEEWETEGEKRHPDPAIQTVWIRWVLTTLLRLPADGLAEGQSIPEGIKAEKPEYGVIIRPNLVLTTFDLQVDELSLDWDDTPKEQQATPATPLLLIQTYARGQGLEKPTKTGDLWAASPAARMQELLAQTQVKLGLITNGEDWMLVHRATDTTGFAQFSAPIWLEESVTLRAFCALLGPERFYGSTDETLLQMLTISAGDHQEVTDQLGYQVRHAVELLVQALDEIDRNRGGELLTEVSETTLYEGALTLMMRLVFLLCAEERGMFPVEEEVYSRNYAISTLMANLREAADAHGEEILERRSDAWSRLLATFSAIWHGVEHEAMRLPAYGGGLLDPNRFPWMDTPTGTPLPIHNRTVLHLLESLQILRVKLPGGGPPETRRLSFRALDIEQIGHVYEGLLDHTAVRATEPVLGLTGTKEREPEIALSTLEALAEKGQKPLLTFLKEETGRSDKALQNGLDKPVVDEGKLMAACEGDAELLARVRPWASLIRQDDFDRYVVIPTGHVYVTSGTARRSSGTHYTPRHLAERICQRTLEPLVYNGFSDGEPASRATLKSPRELLNLRVCDPTVGSGAFLVAGCRYLADRLCEAWANLEEQNPGAVLVSPEGELSEAAPEERIIPDRTQSDERRTLALRLIAERCLYGVDKNPMAAEIAKLALWLVTMNKGKPFHFLDHAIKVGDSLLGCHDLRQLETWSMDGKRDNNALTLFSNVLLDELRVRRQGIVNLPSDTPDQVARKARLYAEFEAKANRARLMADLILAPELVKAKPKEREKQRNGFQDYFVAFPNGEMDGELRAQAESLLDGNRPFHWPLEFIDVYLREEKSGFDAIMGNPPFMGGQKITGEMGVPYRDYLVTWLGRGKKGSADLVAYFFLRAVTLLRDGGCVGLIATSTLAQGDTREVGLDQIVGDGYGIYAADSSFPWPGKAALEVAVVHIFTGDWSGATRILNGAPTGKITAFLDNGASSGKPYRLSANANKSFIGSYVLGMGFVLEPERALALIAKDNRNADVLFSYLNGEDLNSRPDQSPSRWVINFKDWPLGRIGQTLPVNGETMLHIAETTDIGSMSDEWRPKAGSRWENSGTDRCEKWLRIGVVPSDYPGPVAADYPDCLRIIEELVKPEREAQNREIRKRYWWRFAELSRGLYAAIADLSRVLIHPLTSKFNNFVLYPQGIVFSHMTVAFPISEWSHYAILQSDIHWAWVLVYGNKLENRPQYTPSDCLDTFPFPITGTAMGANLAQIGEAYHENRRSLCLARDLGLTKVYNLFHSSTCADADIAHLRELHAGMDSAIAAAYGWEDIDLCHNFYGDAKDTRYTIHPDAKNEVLRRLLALNHARYADEQAESGEIIPTLEIEQEAVIARLGRGANDAPVDPSGGLFSTQTLLTFEEPESTPEIASDAVPLVPSVVRRSSLTRAEVTERTALLATYLVLRATAPAALHRLQPKMKLPQLREAREYHRVRLVKHIYLAQEMVQAGLCDGQPFPGLVFRRNKKGPYTEQIEEAENYAIRKRWLSDGMPDHDDDGNFTKRYGVGPEFVEAVKRLLDLLGDDEPVLDQKLLLLDDRKTSISEQWTTVHFAWKELHDENGKPPTGKQVEDYVEDWKPTRSLFKSEQTRTVLQILKQEQLY